MRREEARMKLSCCLKRDRLPASRARPLETVLLDVPVAAPARRTQRALMRHIERGCAGFLHNQINTKEREN